MKMPKTLTQVFCLTPSGSLIVTVLEGADSPHCFCFFERYVLVQRRSQNNQAIQTKLVRNLNLIKQQ